MSVLKRKSGLVNLENVRIRRGEEGPQRWRNDVQPNVHSSQGDLTPETGLVNLENVSLENENLNLNLTRMQI